MKKFFRYVKHLLEAIAFFLLEKDVRVGSGVLTTRKNVRRYLKFAPSSNNFGVDIIEVFPEDGDYSFGWSPKVWK